MRIYFLKNLLQVPRVYHIFRLKSINLGMYTSALVEFVFDLVVIRVNLNVLHS